MKEATERLILFVKESMTGAPQTLAPRTVALATLAPQRQLHPTDTCSPNTCSPNTCSPWTIAPPTVARQEHLLPWQSFLQLLIRTSNNQTPITQLLN